MMPHQNPKVLFLATQDPSTIAAEWPFYQNWTLPQALEDQGVPVSKLNWRDPATTSQKLTTFDVICFLWCNDYHAYADTFIAFLKNVLTPATVLSPSLRVVNHAGIILWNADKHTYLQDLAAHGYLIPKTTFIPSGRTTDLSSLANTITAFASTLMSTSSVVLKPSISGSSKMTHLIRDPYNLSSSDMTFLETIITNGVSGSLLLQAYEPAISNGEYSMVFINNIHTHTVVKTPARGEFRCQAEFGGGIGQLPTYLVPANAIATAEKIIAHLQRMFPARDDSKGGAVYARIDGVVRDDGQFVLMEIEAIEPHLWLETADAPGCREMLYAALLGKPESEPEREPEPEPESVSVPLVLAQKEKLAVVSVSEVSIVAV